MAFLEHNELVVDERDADRSRHCQGSRRAGIEHRGEPNRRVRINWVLRDGGNKFTGMFFTTYGNHALQANNLTPELQAQGLKTVNGTDKIWDLNPSFGGPLRQDKIWFFASARLWGANDRVTNSWWATDVTSPAYTPDLSRPAIDGAEMKSATFRPTIRVTPQNTVSAFLFDMGRCFCQNGVSSVVTPDADDPGDSRGEPAGRSPGPRRSRTSCCSRPAHSSIISTRGFSRRTKSSPRCSRISRRRQASNTERRRLPRHDDRTQQMVTLSGHRVARTQDRPVAHERQPRQRPPGEPERQSELPERPAAVDRPTRRRTSTGRRI